MSATALRDFLAVLEKGPSQRPCVFNPWRDHDERDHAPRAGTPAIRRENMAAYLEARRTHARVMLLGEAPSHRGCRFTGIAFCSETELVHKAGLVARRPLALTSRDADTKPQRERSAAVIWGEIERAGHPFEVVLWNAFPWHPYRADEGDAASGPCGPSSNRKPRLGEVAEGRHAFEALLRCFTRELDVFAVGKVAQDALARWGGTQCAGYIRHPAQGGEQLFRSQFRSQVAARL
ncbi:MAG: uracil-DNA glycosylase [Usitatibacter sp.]